MNNRRTASGARQNSPRFLFDAIFIMTMAVFICVPGRGIADEKSSERSSAISAGVTGLALFDAFSHTSYIAYETMPFVTPVSLYGKFGQMRSALRTGSYEERTEGSGGEFGMHIYVSEGRQLRGYYVGAGIGLWALSGEWRDDLGTPFVTSGPGRVSVIDLNGHCGKKIFFHSSGAYIDPSLQIGLIGFPKSRPEELGVGGLYVAAGIAAGFAW